MVNEKNNYGLTPHGHIMPHDHPADNTHAHGHARTKAVLNRLSRLIGHLNAVKTMVEQGRDCSEVLIQLAAVRAAVNKTCEIILKDHLENCIVEAVNTGDTKALDEMNRAVELLMK
jgi:DNA-binding FrmR family transcriptional regulator